MIAKTLAAGIVAVTALAAVPANAASFNLQVGPYAQWGQHGGQGYHGHRWHRPQASPAHVRAVLRNHGYRAIRFIDTRGPIYRARAVKHGRAFIVSVNARNGQILSRHRI
jgi:hypothetical protein